MVSIKKEFLLLMFLCSLILIRTYSALSLKGVNEGDPPSLMNYNKEGHGNTLKGSKDELIKLIVQDVSYDVDNFINDQYGKNNNKNNNNNNNNNNSNNYMMSKNVKMNDYIKGDIKPYKNQNNNSKNEKKLEFDHTVRIKPLQNRPLLKIKNKEKNDNIDMKDCIKMNYNKSKTDDNYNSHHEDISNSRKQNNSDNYMKGDQTGNMNFKLNNLNNNKKKKKSNVTKENNTDINNDVIKINNIKKDIPNIDNNNNNNNNVKRSKDKKSMKLEKSSVNNPSRRNILKKRNYKNIINKNDQSKENETSNEHLQMENKKKYTKNLNNNNNNNVDGDDNTTISNKQSINISSTNEHKKKSMNNQDKQELQNEIHHKNKLTEMSYDGDAIEIRIISDPRFVKNDLKKTQKNKKNQIKEKNLLRLKNGKRNKWLKGVPKKKSKRREVEREKDHTKSTSKNYK